MMSNFFYTLFISNPRSRVSADYPSALKRHARFISSKLMPFNGVCFVKVYR